MKSRVMPWRKETWCVQMGSQSVQMETHVVPWHLDSTGAALFQTACVAQMESIVVQVDIHVKSVAASVPDKQKHGYLRNSNKGLRLVSSQRYAAFLILGKNLNPNHPNHKI